MAFRPRILIISNGPLCRNPRVVKEANILGSTGYDVTVLTVRDHAPSEIQDRLLLAGAPFRRLTVDMLPGLGTSGLVVWWRRLRLWLARNLAKRGWHSIHALGPAAALWRAARSHPAELVIVHNEISHWVGVRLLASGRRVAADIEDWHSEDLLPEARRHRPLAILRQVEGALLHRALFTTTTSHALAAALHSRYGGKIPAVLTNSFPLQPNFRTDGPSEPPAFFWFSQTLGPGRGLELFVAAWSRMRQPSQLVLLGTTAGDFAERLRQSAPAERQSWIKFLPLVSPAELPSVIARHDIGLALEERSIASRDLTITNKILQYLNAGLAVVATATQGQREVLAESPLAGLLIEGSDPLYWAAQLDDLVADRSMLAQRQQAARHLAETHYCWEKETSRHLSRIHSALAHPLHAETTRR